MTNDHKDKPQPSVGSLNKYRRLLNADATTALEYKNATAELVVLADTLSSQLSEARQQSEAEAIAYSSLSAEHERLKAQLSEAQARLAEIELQEEETWAKVHAKINEESRWCCCGDCPPKAAPVAPAAQAMCGCGDTFGEGSVCANCLCGKYVEAGHAVADDVVRDGEFHVPTLEAVLRGLKSEDDSTQLRAIISEVETMLAAQQQKVKP